MKLRTVFSEKFFTTNMTLTVLTSKPLLSSVHKLFMSEKIRSTLALEPGIHIKNSTTIFKFGKSPSISAI